MCYCAMYLLKIFAKMPFWNILVSIDVLGLIAICLDFDIFHNVLTYLLNIKIDFLSYLYHFWFLQPDTCMALFLPIHILFSKIWEFFFTSLECKIAFFYLFSDIIPMFVGFLTSMIFLTFCMALHVCLSGPKEAPPLLGNTGSGGPNYQGPMLQAN